MYQKVTLAAGVAVEFTEQSDFFRLLDSVPTDIQLIFYAMGREVGQAANIQSGYSEEIPAGFDRVRISSATGGDVSFVMRYGNKVRYDKAPTGNVTIAGNQGAFTQAAATVTSASGQLLAAKTTRRYLLIQNNDASGVIYVTLNGTAATLTNGIKVDVGGSIELQGYVPTGAINAIGSIASNANVIVVEG